MKNSHHKVSIILSNVTPVITQINTEGKKETEGAIESKYELIHTVNHSGRKPKTDVREAKTMLDKARATFCLTCQKQIM